MQIDKLLVSRGQTSISAQGVYRLQYKRPSRKGSGPVHSADSFLTRSLTFVYTFGAHKSTSWATRSLVVCAYN